MVMYPKSIGAALAVVIIGAALFGAGWLPGNALSDAQVREEIIDESIARYQCSAAIWMGRQRQSG
jgi:hypothetical protein